MTDAAIERLDDVRMDEVRLTTPVADAELARLKLGARLDEMYRGLAPFSMGCFGETTARKDEVVSRALGAVRSPPEIRRARFPEDLTRL